MFVADIVGFVAVAAVVAYLYRRYRSQVSTFVTGVENKGSAFARIAEQDGKIIALKAVTAVKKEEAHAAHAALDEIDKLLG